MTETVKQHAIFVGSTNIPNSIVDNPEFRSVVNVLNSQYPVAGRMLISGYKVLVTLKGNVHTMLSQAHKVSLCADIWSKKGLTSSCLGITAHFFSKMDHHHHHHVVTLCVKRMPSAHTTQNNL